MALRQSLATLLAAVVLSTGIGFVLGQANDSATAAGGSTAGQLKDIKAELVKANKALGSPVGLYGPVNVIDLLQEVCQNTGGSSLDC